MLQPGTRVDRYEILSSIGTGGMATVYAARHIELGSLHGLKVMSLTSPGLVSRVLQEGRIQARLRHPNVVPVTDVLRIQGVPALVMDLVVGPSLETLIGARRLHVDQVDHLARGILAGVGAAHNQGRVHRDIKPGNVLLELTHEGVVPRVADFGLAKITGNDSMSRSRTGVVMGTPAFMAPEQFRNAKGVGPTADVFSLGVLLYQLLTNELPFPGNDLISIFRSIESQDFVHPSKRVPGLPRAMNDAIVAALKFDAEERPQNASELAALWMELRAEPLQPFSNEEIRGLRTMGVRLNASVPPEASDPGGQPLVNLSDQADLVDLAEGSLWPTSLGGSGPTLAPRPVSPEPRVPKEAEAAALAEVSIPPAGPPERASWGIWVVVAVVILGMGAWIVRGEASKMQGGEAPVPVVPVSESAPAPSPDPIAPPPAAEATPAPEVQPTETAPSEPDPMRPNAATSEPVAEAAAPAPVRSAPAASASKPAVQAKARVRLSGVERGFAVDSAGAQHGLSNLAPGRYVIYAYFEAARATKVLELSLAEGQKVSLSCVPAMRMCKPT